jgi:hypothetical protein
VARSSSTASYATPNLILDGDIVRVSGSCRRETFNVIGHVMLLSDGIPTGDFGDFEVTLTLRPARP